MARGRPSKKPLILATAQQLFCERGYQGTSIDLVVKHSQVSKPTVYNNFPSKQDLLETLITSQLELIEHRHRQFAEQTLPVAKAVYQIFSAILNTPFELAIIRIYYGEQYKLAAPCIAQCQAFEDIIDRAVLERLAPLGLSTVQQHALLALCKQHLLHAKLQNKPILSCEELTSQLHVLGWD